MQERWLVAEFVLPVFPIRHTSPSSHLTGDSHGTLSSFHRVVFSNVLKSVSKVAWTKLCLLWTHLHDQPVIVYGSIVLLYL